MTAHDQNIVISGLGLVTSLGRTPEETWSAIIEGRSGLAPMPELEQRPTPDKGGGQAVELATEFRPELSRAARYLRFAAERAIGEARLDARSSDRVGAAFGTTLHGMRAGGRFFRSGDPRELRDFLAGRVLQQAMDGLGVGGPMLTTCSACSSGLGAIALAVTLLRSGEVDVVVTGGYDSVSEYSYAGFDSLRLIAARSCRPFAADRDGMKVAEGYGAVVLERASDAAARGATVLAAIAGFGESSDAFHLTQPHPEGEGATRAARAALGMAGTNPGEIDLISAHATSTPNNDAAEYAALHSIFGESLASTPVVAFKSHLGHTLGGAGAVELVLTVMAMRRGRVPPTLTSAVEPGFSHLSLVRDRAEAKKIRSSIGLSLGFGGANTCVVVRSPELPMLEPTATDAGDAVITGVGIVIPGAIGAEEFRQLLNGGRPPVRGAGPIPEDRYAALITTRRARRLSEYARLTLAAAEDACRHGSVQDRPAFFADAAAILGTTHGATGYCESFYGQIVREGLAAANPVLFAEGVPNAGAAQLSLMLGIRGSCQTIIGTRCAGLDALRLASLRIRAGLWQRAIVGAAEEYSAVVTTAYEACGLGDETASDPLSLGAGAVAMLLESRASAASRGARVMGTIGEGCWSSGPIDTAAGEVGRRLGNCAQVLTCYGDWCPDRMAVRALGRANTAPFRTVAPFVPELFSVGPLLAAAAGLIEVGAPTLAAADSDFAVVASEFTGSATGVRVRPV